MVTAEYLEPLPEDKIQRMYSDAISREAVFRNILSCFVDNKDEAAFLKTASIDDIFDKYVKIEGQVTRICDYKLGPDPDIPQLTDQEALIHIKNPGMGLKKKYRILENDQVEFLETVSVMMH